MKSIGALLKDWNEACDRMKRLQKNVPRIAGAESVKVVKNNFKLQGYDTGHGINEWKQRDEKTNKAYDRRSGVKGSVYQSSNPLLLQTRNLFNSVKFRADDRKVFIGVNTATVPYAEPMNNERKYLPVNEPPTKPMVDAIDKKVKTEREKALANFKK